MTHKLLRVLEVIASAVFVAFITVVFMATMCMQAEIGYHDPPTIQE